MTDAEAKVVLRLVRGYVQARYGDADLARGFNTADPEQIESFLEAMAVAWQKTPPDPDVTACELLEVQVVAAMCLLGPPGVPPKAMREDLFNRVENSGCGGVQPEERIIEVVVAYGGGWGRNVEQSGDWDGRWGRAIRAIIGWMKTPLVDVDEWLRRHSGRFRQAAPAAWSGPWRDHVGYQARLLASIFCHPESLIAVGKDESVQVGDVQLDAPINPDDGLWQDFDIYLTVPGRPDRQLKPSSRCVLATDSVISLTLGDGRLTKCGRVRTRITVRAGDSEARLGFEPPIRCGRDVVRESKLITGQRVTLRGPAKLKEFECACGHGGCAPEHRLSGWSPALLDADGSPIRLWNFVASGVRGPFKKGTKIEGDTDEERREARLRGMQIGTVKQGMTVPRMISDPDFGMVSLRLAQVEFQTNGRNDAKECVILETDTRYRYIGMRRVSPLIQRRLRVRCRAKVNGKPCKNLLPVPSVAQINQQCYCNGCGGPLFVVKNLSNGLDAKSRLEKARQVDRKCWELCQAGAHNDCGLEPAVWCNFCAGTRDAEQGDCALSQRTTTVWVWNPAPGVQGAGQGPGPGGGGTNE